VADADVILAFWDGLMCRSLVNELGLEQPKTTKELLEIATWHASGEEAIEVAFTLVNAGMAVSGGQGTPTSTTVRSTKKGAKGGKKGQKCRLHHIAIMASNGDTEEEVNNSNKEFMATTECDLKRRTRPSKDHLEKILKVACPHHPYPIKHKLRDCTMARNSWHKGHPLAVMS
jgi:hypothetical protein